MNVRERYFVLSDIIGGFILLNMALCILLLADVARLYAWMKWSHPKFLLVQIYFFVWFLEYTLW